MINASKRTVLNLRNTTVHYMAPISAHCYVIVFNIYQGPLEYAFAGPVTSRTHAKSVKSAFKNRYDVA